jgi:hypothetical protein
VPRSTKVVVASAAVKAGTLTQAEADAVTKAVEKGVIGGR